MKSADTNIYSKILSFKEILSNYKFNLKRIFLLNKIVQLIQIIYTENSVNFSALSYIFVLLSSIASEFKSGACWHS
jgi:hypothetical protein